MQGIALRQAMAKHPNKIWGALLFIACAGWASTYVDLLKAHTLGGFADQWWLANRTALRYTYAHDRDPNSKDFSLAREDMLTQIRISPEGAFPLLEASRKAGDLALHQQLIKEVANVSTLHHMSIIGDWLLEELDETSGAAKVSGQADGLLTEEQRAKLAECHGRAKELKFNQVVSQAVMYGIPDMTGPAECNL